MVEIAEQKVVSIGGFDIPEHIIGRILEYCALNEIVRLKKISKSFRQAMGFLKPDLHITHFDFELDSLEIVCKIKTGSDIIEVQYKKHRNGCTVKRIGSEKEHFVDRNFVLAFLMDIFGFLCFQTSPVEFFRLNFHFYSDDEKIEDVEALANEFLKHSIFSLQRRQAPFQVRNFTMNFIQDSQVCQILQSFDPNYLQKLNLHKQYFPLYEKVMETLIPKTPHWKNVRELNLGDSVYDGSISDFVHFDKAKVRLEEITLQELVELKDAFLISPSFEQLELELIHFNESLFLEVFGPPLLFSDDASGKWLFENQANRKLISLQFCSDGNKLTFRPENWNEIAETFSTVSDMEFILNEVGKCFSDALDKKSVFMMNMKDSFKNRLHNVHININATNATFSFDLNTNPLTDRIYFYEDHEDGCMSVLGNERKLIREQNFVAVLLNDLEFLLKYQTSTILNFKLYLHTKNNLNTRNEEKEFVTKKFLTNFKEILESRNESLRVTALYMNPTSPGRIMAVLPFLKSGCLETIHFEYHNQDILRDPDQEVLAPELKKLSLEEKLYLEIGDIVKLKQWKKAKRLLLDNLIISTPIRNLLGFHIASVTLQSITVSDLEILETSLQSSYIFLKLGYIDLNVTDENKSIRNRPYDTFGRPSNVYKDPENRLVKTWYFPIDGTDQDVVIEHRSDKILTFYRASSETRRKEKTESDWTGLLLLSNVVPEVMENILEKVDFRSILVLRKVCWDLRNFINDTRIDDRPREFFMSVDFNSIETRFGYTGELIHLHYKDENDCVLVQEETDSKNNPNGSFKRTAVKNVDYFSAFFKDLDSILGHPKSIWNNFSIEFPFITDNKEIADLVLGRLKEYLQSRENMLAVEKISIKAVEQSEFMHILPYINPKNLKTIELINQNEEENRLIVYEISKLDQWKMAEKLAMKNFVTSLSLEKLFHFSKVECCVDTITVADLLRVKDECLKFPKEFSLECKTFDSEDLFNILGRPLREITPEGIRNRKWFYKIPNNFESVVQLLIDSSPSINLTRIPVSFIPKNGIIQD